MVEGIAVAAEMAALFLWLGSRVFLSESAETHPTLPGGARQGRVRCQVS